MRTSRMLLRLLLLVGSLILLLDAHSRGLATYSAECGVYNTVYQNCPSPCKQNWYKSTWTADGPFYISGNEDWCANSEYDCSNVTEILAASLPQRSTACGCGATGQWCQDDTDCCGTDLCQVPEGGQGTCVTCLDDGYGTCDTNADCCSKYCDCYGYCGCDGLGEDCCTNADCCNGNCSGGTCQPLPNCPKTCPDPYCSDPGAYCWAMCGCPGNEACSDCYTACVSEMTAGCENTCVDCGVCCADPKRHKPRGASVTASALPDLFR